MLDPGSFEKAWPKDSVAMVVMRNSLRSKTYHKAEELLDQIAKSLVPGGLYLTDGDAMWGIELGVKSHAERGYSRESYARLFEMPYQVGEGDPETWVFAKRKKLLTRAEVCAETLTGPAR